ncbi:GtrA family protein [uncultured Clostridium sp.]|uniref:GtrA family protein n=3 Tax=Clostridium TaxID=1485 RepID=UPI00262CA373|nr:GtrA family protein [uncultured Clostridium sp.]
MNYCGKEMYKFIKFGFVGILNTLINWIIFAILNICGVYYLVSNFIAYIVATINSYIWNSKWVFKYNGERRNETTIKFIVLNLIGLVLNTSILYLLVDKLLVDKLIALIITTLIVMVINYISNNMWVFK